jgi:N-methylhydantoinase B
MGDDAFFIRWNGGGGYGDPLEREARSVLLDVRERTVSSKAAKNVYGVVLTEGNASVDEAATAKARTEMYAARLNLEAAE